MVLSLLSLLVKFLLELHHLELFLLFFGLQVDLLSLQPGLSYELVGVQGIRVLNVLRFASFLYILDHIQSFDDELVAEFLRQLLFFVLRIFIQFFKWIKRAI